MEKLSLSKPKANIKANHPSLSAHEWVCAFQPGAVLTRFTGYITQSINRKDDNIIQSSTPWPGVSGRVPLPSATLWLLSSGLWFGARSRQEALGFVQHSDHQVGRRLLWAQLSEAARNLPTSEL